MLEVLLICGWMIILNVIVIVKSLENKKLEKKISILEKKLAEKEVVK